MEQNTIAFIWDFDKTLITGYMQEPIFKKYSINASAFWKEVNSLPELYQKENIRVNRDTIYLNHMLTCVGQGMFEGLNNKLLFELGKELEFYPGVLDIFASLKSQIANEPKYQKYGIHVEHYIVSTGLTSMIQSKMTAKSINYDTDEIRQTGYLIDNTSKTRAIFEINKGVNKYQYIDVNSHMEAKDRRVPFEHMVYIADGSTFAIYPKGDARAFQQVDGLRKDGRIDMYAEADYSEGTMAYMWLTAKATEIADAIYQAREDEIKEAVKGKVPTHLT